MTTDFMSSTVVEAISQLPRPRIACCIPAKDPGPEIDETLRSLGQSTLPCYVVLIDDGSRTPIQIDLASYGLVGLCLRFERNLGISAALNAGMLFAYTNGFDYIARMDADDINLPDRFNAQVEFLENNPGHQIVFGAAILIDGDGTPFGIRSSPESAHSLARAMAINNVLIHPTAFFRTSYITRYGLFAEKARYAEDYEYFMRAVRDDTVHVLSTPLIEYRISSSSISFAKYRGQLFSRLRTQITCLGWTGSAGLLGVVRTVTVLLAACLTPGGLLSDLRRRWMKLRGRW